jgi:aminoglycoside 3'-phosphotransferase II
MSMDFPSTLPFKLKHLEAGAWQRVTLGKSEAAVWRVELEGETLFLKVSPVHPLSETPGEVSRLRWLASTSLAAPRLRETFEANGAHWLLMTAVPGHDLTHLIQQPTELITVLATALRTVHRLDPAACPFDQSLDRKLAMGAANAAAGLVDDTDFDDDHLGWTASAVLDLLHADRPASEDLVVCHGDASLPNFMADAGAFTGVIDCGRFGVADRWQDLAIACRSIRFNLGAAHLSAFLEAYGAPWDEARYRYYNALDELF